MARKHSKTIHCGTITVEQQLKMMKSRSFKITGAGVHLSKKDKDRKRSGRQYEKYRKELKAGRCKMEYFISDTHFGHKKIINFERTQFSTIEEHDKEILRLLKNVLKKEDILYHLGDFGFGLSKELLKEWKEVKAKKILILGNHDTYSKVVPYFDEVSKTPIFLTQRILLSHYPLPVTNGTLNIHGHLHNYTLDKENYICVNIHQLNYKPLSRKKIDKILQKTPADNWKFMKEWFVDLYKKIE